MDKCCSCGHWYSCYPGGLLKKKKKKQDTLGLFSLLFITFFCKIPISNAFSSLVASERVPMYNKAWRCANVKHDSNCSIWNAVWFLFDLVITAFETFPDWEILCPRYPKHIQAPVSIRLDNFWAQTYEVWKMFQILNREDHNSPGDPI